MVSKATDSRETDYIYLTQSSTHHDSSYTDHICKHGSDKRKTTKSCSALATTRGPDITLQTRQDDVFGSARLKPESTDRQIPIPYPLQASYGTSIRTSQNKQSAAQSIVTFPSGHDNARPSGVLLSAADNWLMARRSGSLFPVRNTRCSRMPHFWPFYLPAPGI